MLRTCCAGRDEARAYRKQLNAKIELTVPRIIDLGKELTKQMKACSITNASGANEQPEVKEQTNPEAPEVIILPPPEAKEQTNPEAPEVIILPPPEEKEEAKEGETCVRPTNVWVGYKNNRLEGARNVPGNARSKTSSRSHSRESFQFLRSAGVGRRRRAHAENRTMSPGSTFRKFTIEPLEAYFNLFRQPVSSTCPGGTAGHSTVAACVAIH
eukprot:1176991-Prorocentrum_minimum.AAC.8